MILFALLAALLVITWTPRRRGPRRRDARRLRLLRRWPVRVTHRHRVPDVAAVVSEVASRLRSGATIESAWDRAAERVLGPGPLPDGSARPGLTSVLAGSTHVPVGLARLAERCRGDHTAAAAIQTVLAATTLAQTLGAPLAEVLDRCARSVVEAERAGDARRVALAGPRSTARVLMGLPLFGLVLGAGLGADPLAAALDGAWGTLAVVTGAGLLLAGARWTRALVAAAQDPAPRWRRQVVGP